MLDDALYLDHSATTPPHPEVIEAMRAAMTLSWGNPSSLHGWGERAALAMETARWQVADLLGANPEDIIFTSGGTESNTMALRGIARLYPQPHHMVISAVEHSSISKTADDLAALGWQISRIPVTTEGHVTLDALAGSLQANTVLVSVIHGQNEIGTVQPIQELAAFCHERGIRFHSDAIQTVGKLPICLDQSSIDLLSLSGHKFYGPQGIGALYISPRLRAGLHPLLLGGGQENGLRSGTQPLPGIVGLGQAAVLARRDLSLELTRLRQLQAQLHQALQKFPALIGVGSQDLSQRLPHHLSYCVRGHSGRSVVQHLSRLGLAISAGSACHQGKTTASQTLLALGIPAELAQGGIRLSLGRSTTMESLERVVAALTELLGAPQPLSLGYASH
jgi:cysteine desulfurase